MILLGCLLQTSAVSVKQTLSSDLRKSFTLSKKKTMSWDATETITTSLPTLPVPRITEVSGILAKVTPPKTKMTRTSKITELAGMKSGK